MRTLRPSLLSRRAALGLVGGATLAPILPASAQQQQRGGGFGGGGGGGPGGGGPLQVDVDQANLRPRPIAIPEFISDDPRLGSGVANVIAANLERSGLFEPLDPRGFVERITDHNIAPRFADWRSAGAEALVVGRATGGGDRVHAEFRLWDVVLGKQLAAGQFTTGSQNWRRVGHIISDQVWEKLTLEKGYFDTRIVFIDETGPKDKRVKRLAIMDQDGFNVRLLSQGQELVLTPRFSPSNQEITYMSYTRDQPRVVRMRLDSGQKEIVGDFPGMTFAPRFSPDGQRVVMSIQQGSDSSIVEMDMRSRQTRQLTRGNGLDTGPCYAPDGRQIVFESDREGTQQLYVMGADGGGARRISFNEGRYSTPVWSPRGDYIAFTKQQGGRFLIGVMRFDGQGERILTEGFHNEGPTWAPNGRFIMFFRDLSGPNGGPKLFTIDLTGRNEREVKTPSFASDPAWSPLQK